MPRFQPCALTIAPRWTRRARPLIMHAAWCILAAIVFCFLSAGPADADDGKPTPVFREIPQAQQPAHPEQADIPGRAVAPGREDMIMGTFHEGMSMERDEDTGDVFLRAGPKPKPEPEQQQIPPIYVTPEVKIPAQP